MISPTPPVQPVIEQIQKALDAGPWRCFHCDESFHDEAEARLHFGRSERQSPACQIDIAEYREMEARMVSYNEEDSDMHRQIYRMESAHAAALKAEEEKGYARGLADGAPYLAEREATLTLLREALEQILRSVPASDGNGGFIVEHHTMDGEYAGTEQIDPAWVMSEMADIAEAALNQNQGEPK